MTKIHAKTSVRSRKRVTRIAGAVEAGGSYLARSLRRKLGEDGWAVGPACVEELGQSVVRVLEAHERRLAEAVMERQKVADRGKALRRRRDEACRDVYDLLVGLRKILDATAGDRAVRALFGKGKTPREPREVWRMASDLAPKLRDEKSRSTLCGRIGSEEVFLHWLEEVREPLERLRTCLREVGRVETEERRTVPAVRRAKAEMREAQKYAYRLLEGLYGLAGLEQLGRDLRLRDTVSGRETAAEPAASPSKDRSAPPASPTAEPSTAMASPRRLGSTPTNPTAPPGPAGDRPTDRTTIPGALGSRPCNAGLEDGPAGTAPNIRTTETAGPVSARTTRSRRPGPAGGGRTNATRREGPAPKSGRLPAETAGSLDRNSEPLEGAVPGVRNDLKLLHGIPHRWKRAAEAPEITAFDEQAA